MFRRFDRYALTLVELLVAMSIMAVVIGTLGTLAKAVQQAYEYTEGTGLATQHGRVVLERIGRKVSEASANEQFPGAIVVAQQAGSWQFPETLVIWHPAGLPAAPEGLPRFSELVIYCPNKLAPNQLVEITMPDDQRTVPPVSDTAQWAAEINAIRGGTAAHSVILTDLLRTCTTSAAADRRGAARFETRLRPSQDEWNNYKSGTLAWNRLAWVQGIYGSQTGLRQTWVRIELQLMPGKNLVTTAAAGVRPIPFFDSSALYYEMHK